MTRVPATLPFPLGGPPTILDGGLATELEAQGHDLSDALWSARLLADRPDAIVEAHLAFYRAGASVATTASYQASFAGFAAHGIERRAAAALMARSVELARDAADQLAERRPTALGGRVRRTVRRRAGGRLGVPRPVRPDGRRAECVAPAAARGPRRGRP